MKFEKKQKIVFRNGREGMVKNENKILVGLFGHLDINGGFYDKNLEATRSSSYDIESISDENGNVLWERGDDTRWLVEKDDALELLTIVEERLDLEKTKDYLEYKRFMGMFKRY